MKKTLSSLVSLFLIGPSTGQLLFTQYYEGTSNNKYLELTNTGDSDLDLSTFSLGLFSNGFAESWKDGGSANDTVILSGTLAAGASYVLANSSAVSPLPADQANLTSGVVNFNGNDSVVLYDGLDENDLALQTVENIVDAVSVTDGAGNQSAVRISGDAGFDLTIGTSYFDFPSVWQTATLDEVDMAVIGDNLFLGSSVLGESFTVVGLEMATIIAEEDSGQVTVAVSIDNPSGEEVSVDLVYDDTSTAELSELGNYTTQTVTFPAGAVTGDTQEIVIQLTNDEETEPTEQAFFRLENLQSNGDVILSGSNLLTLTILDDDTEVPQIYISEIADPQDGSNARFIEIFNPTDDEIDLEGQNWNLVVYFNGNTSGNDIPLLGVIPAGGLFVVARNDADYATAYPNAPVPNQLSGDINSNGNETFELRFGGGAATGILVDIYGTVGVNGAGEPSDFGDAQVTRSTAGPSRVFDLSQWTITPATIATVTPGSLVPVNPTADELMVTGTAINLMDGSLTLTVSGLGSGAGFTVQVSDDLNQEDAWAEASDVSFAGPQDTPTGFIVFDDGLNQGGKRFYRVVEN